MTPEFSSLVDPVFQSVLELIRRIERGERVDLQLERSNIRNVIDDAERRASTPRSSVSLQDFQIAKHALVYWADEVLTEAAPDWKDILLEREYFNSRTRAWRFYVEGEMNGRHASPDVTETFYLGVVLGFVGDIRDAFKNHMNRELPGNEADPEAARQAWARQLEQRLRETPQTEVSGEALEGHVAPLTGDALKRAGLIVFGTIVAVCTVFWLGSLFAESDPEDEVRMKNAPTNFYVGGAVDVRNQIARCGFRLVELPRA